MELDITTLAPDSRWSVIFRDGGSWRAGLYRPEAAGPVQVSVLEKHTCPELFVCLQGRAGLVLKNGTDERIVEMAPNQALLVTEYHNGFAIDPEGYFLVIERTAFTTEYIDRKTGAFIRKVEVKEDTVL
ncbi:MAG TPA: hypothetical protein P5115_20175 [Spirochaetota bacterium]|nr:hypothetical protein [Spirochaetota bacterium]